MGDSSPAQVPRFRTQRVVCSVSVPQGQHKVLQLVFQKRDGSVFVAFPYYKYSSGLVTVATVPAADPSASDEGVQVELKPGGKVTSHLVKYAHHPDGEAHFSQTGKVITQVRRKAVPLDEAGGHLFTTHLVGYTEFMPVTLAESRRPPEAKRTLLNFEFANTPRAIKIVGRLFTADSLKFEGQVPPMPGPVPTVDQDGVTRFAFLASPPEGWGGDHRIVMLTAEEWTPTDRPTGPHLSLIGGFDPPEIARNPTKATTVLALSYPIDSPEELQRDLGSIDFHPSS